MALDTSNRGMPNRGTQDLLPPGLLDEDTREALFGSPYPSLLLRSDGRTPLWASDAAARKLGFRDAPALLRARLSESAPGTRRLAELAQDDEAGVVPRLERLRFFVGFRGVVLTALCQALVLANGENALWVGFVEQGHAETPTTLLPAETPAIEASTLYETASDHTKTTAADMPRAAADMPKADAALSAEAAHISHQRSIDLTLPEPSRPEILSPETSAAEHPVSENPVSEPPISEHRVSTRPAWTDAPEGHLAARRFVFSLSETGVVTAVTPPLADSVGAANADILGHDLASVIAGFDASAAERIREAVSAGQTWTGITVDWPVAGTALRVPIDMSALPVTDIKSVFSGYSGFGRCRIGDAVGTLLPPAVEDAVAEDSDQPDVEAASEDVAALDVAALPFTAPQALTEQQAVIGDLFEVNTTQAASEANAAHPPDASVAPEAHGPSPDDDADIEEDSGAEDDGSGDTPAIADAGTPAEVVSEAPDSPEDLAPPNANVVALRNGPVPVPPAAARGGLSMSERNAFREIAKALGARFEEGDAEPPASEPAVTSPPPPLTTNFELPAQLPVKGASPLPPAGSPDQALLDRLPMGMLVIRGDETLFANRTLLDLTGYPDFATFLHEDGARAIFRKGTMPRDDREGFDTIVLAARDGEMMPVEAHLQLVQWEGRQATLMSLRRAVELEQGKALRTVALDLKRVRGEAAEYRAVLDTATDGVVTLDEKGQILALNGAAEALFGVNQNEIVGESFTRLIHAESHAAALDYLDGLRAEGVRSVLNDGREIAGREKKGGRIPLFMTLGRINDEEPKRFCAVLRDLTNWKRVEAQLTDARRAAELASAKKSDFLTKISHEIRTPMNAIIGFAEVMQEERLGPVGNPRYKEYLDDIRTSGKHVVSLVNDLLDLAKIEAGRMEMTFDATDVNTIVAGCVGIIQPQANANRVLVRTQLAPNFPKVVADERSIRQIVLNMLSNATRFTEAGGQVIVSTAMLETGEAVIRIRDTGVGMTNTEIEQALEPFRQVGTQRNRGGTGLGLPLTKALVEANRAAFGIKSTPGEGTLVEVTFPPTRVLAE